MVIQNAPFQPLDTYARMAPDSISANSGRLEYPANGISTAATTQTSAVVEVHSTSENNKIIPPWQSKGSALGVSYQHGINLAEARESGSSKLMSPEDLIALPSKLREEAVTEAQELLITTAMVGPAVEWAVANGVLAKRENYTSAEIQQAFLALENIHDETATALASLTRPVPMRKNYYTGTESVSPIKGHADPDNKQYLIAKYDDEEFIEEFKSDLANKKDAYRILIKQVLSTLPLEDRVAVDRGEVKLYALKAQGSENDLDRSSFFLKSVHEGKTTFIEVNPGAMTARRRDDLQSILNGSNVIGKKKLADGSFSEELSVMERPNIQSNKYLPKAEREKIKLLNNDVFSAKLYGLQELAVVPSIARSGDADNVPPNTFSSQRSNDIANTMTEKLFYIKDLELLQLAQDDPDRMTPEEKEDRKNYKEFYEERESRRAITYGVLKGFVPLYNSIEAFVEGKPIEGLGYLLMDILGLVSPPVGKLITGALKKGLSIVPSAIKSPFNNAAKYLNRVVNYTPRQLKSNVAYQGAVPGIKWTGGASPDADTLTNQFKANMKSVPADAAHSHPVELNGHAYFVQNKPDAGDGVHYLLRVKDPKNPTKLVSSGVVAKPDATGAWKRRGFHGVAPVDEIPVQNGKLIKLKGTMENLKEVGDDLYTFVDLNKKDKQVRLNILAHGEEPNSWTVGTDTKTPARIVYEGKPHTAQELLDTLKAKGINPSDYDNVRLLMCFSGNGKGSSFAAEFSRLIAKPVKGYEGTLSAYVVPEVISELKAKATTYIAKSLGGENQLLPVERRAVNDIATHYVKGKMAGKAFEIAKKNPHYNPIAAWTFTYRPVTFSPTP